MPARLRRHQDSDHRQQNAVRRAAEGRQRRLPGRFRRSPRLACFGRDLLPHRRGVIRSAVRGGGLPWRLHQSHRVPRLDAGHHEALESYEGSRLPARPAVIEERDL